MYKITNKLIDIPLDSRLQPNKRFTRGHNKKYQEPSARIELYRNSFYPRTIKEWNKLPAYIVDAPTANSFKQRLERYLTNPEKYHSRF